MAQPPDHTQTKQPKPGERTGAQKADTLGVLSNLPGLSIVPPGTYDVYRKMRRDPTIALARMIVQAPILASAWTIEANDDAPADALELIEQTIMPMRRHIVACCLRAVLDYGWQGFEKIFDVDGGRIVLRKLKPLMQDITKIQANRETGRFEGFKQREVTLPLEKCLLYTADKEGDNYYGRPRLENARGPWSWWNDANEAAARYDRKLSSAIFVVHYPPGESIDHTGATVDNYVIAQRLASNLGAGKCVAISNDFARLSGTRMDADAKENKQWIIELMEDKGARQSSFKERLTYLDSLKFRSVLRPERAALEAQKGGIGTSDAADMQDISLTDAELIHLDIVEHVNWYAVDQVLALNFGPDSRGSVWITPAPLQNTKLTRLVSLLDKWASTPDGREDLRLRLDLDAVLDMAEWPVIDESEREEQEEDDATDDIDKAVDDAIQRMQQGSGNVTNNPQPPGPVRVGGDAGA